MARPSIPTAIQDAKGYFEAHPERKHKAEPTDNRPLGCPPSWFSEEQAESWHEIADELLPGVAKRSDRRAFAMLVVLDLRFKQGLLEKAADRTSLLALYARFAMTPSDRTKVQVDEPVKSALAAFLNRQTPTQD